MADPGSPVTRVNALLKAAGYECRLVRGRGYYYLMDFEGPESMIMAYRLEHTEQDFEFALFNVNDLLAKAGMAHVGVAAPSVGG